jgi:thiol:disulfide interchange protein
MEFVRAAGGLGTELMLKLRLLTILAMALGGAAGAFGFDFGAAASKGPQTSDLVKISVDNRNWILADQHTPAFAVHFTINPDWHFYADSTAPGGASLTIEPNGPGFLVFSAPILPFGTEYNDPYTGTKTSILSGTFWVELPFALKRDANTVPGPKHINIRIHGALCSAQQCRMFNQQISADVNYPAANPFRMRAICGGPRVAHSIGQARSEDYSWWFALGLAFIAGVVLNIMPCVLPVIPLKVLSIFEQAKESRFRCFTLGLAFCGGILVFFAGIAIANIILRAGYGSVFQWGEHFRHPAFVIGMALLMVVLAMIMFGAATVTVPGNVGAGRQRGGYGGAAGMGLLAALLSTPCSFAILTAAFAWAQSQALWLSTIAIMLIGIGMAAPYLVLISMPGLLKYLPRPGRWMEIFKQTMGFVLLIVGIWLISVLPEHSRANVLYFALILAFCVWMWGSWVRFDSPAAKKWAIRTIAIVIAIVTGWLLLQGTAAADSAAQQRMQQGSIEWQPYDADKIKLYLDRGRPVLVDWTADWCLTCKAVEKTVYGRDDIQQLLKAKNILTMKADTTWSSNKAAIDLEKIYNEPGVPVQMLFVPGQDKPVRLPGLVVGEELKHLLEGVK